MMTKTKKQRTVKIAIGVPSGSEWDADFGMSLAMMMSYAAQVRLGPDVHAQQMHVINVKGSILPQLRENIVKNALKIKADYLVFLDSDMVFPKDLLHRMYSQHQLVVAANCPTKQIPSSPTARLFNPDDPKGEAVFSLGRAGLERVWRVGTGVMMIKLSIFKNLPQPWFGIRWEAGVNDYVGEDWAFCQLLEENNIPIFIEHGMSQQIGHSGTLMYRHEHIFKPEEVEQVRDSMKVSNG